jgi:hypothetical protein
MSAYEPGIRVAFDPDPAMQVLAHRALMALAIAVVLVL